MDRRLNRKGAVDTCFVIYILLTVVDILLIFALLMLEIMPYKKEHINVTAAGIANPRAPNNGIQMTNQPINNIPVTIPNGAVPGQILQIQTPQGNAIQVQVPEGAVPGQIVMVKSG